MAHPLCTKGSQRETHYFDWRWGGRTAEDKRRLDLQEEDTEGHAREYAKYVFCSMFFLSFLGCDLSLSLSISLSRAISARLHSLK
jgi:hypothetical protein